MIVLKSTDELRKVFGKLIGTLSVPVEWDGNFVVMDNFLVLSGRERSVIFNYDTRRVSTNIIDLKLDKVNVQTISPQSQLINIFNLVLYAFGKWGALKGITVEKDETQINTLFGAVFGQIGVTAEYTAQYCFLYKGDMRITYEDAIQLAIEKDNDEVEDEEDKTAGLWHNMVWKVVNEEFAFSRTSLEERKRGRLGNNFYKVGYDCPRCGQKLYMAVFPEKDEPVIDTVNGQVRMARVFYCPECSVFFTPIPLKNLTDKDVFVLDFDGDRSAAGDYMEMLGKLAGDEPNGKFNEYVGAEKAEEQNKRPDLNSIDKGIDDKRVDLSGVDKGIDDKRVDLNGIDKGIDDKRVDLSGVDKGIEDERVDLSGIDKGIEDERVDLNGIDKGIKDGRVDLNGIDKGIGDNYRNLNGINKFDEIIKAEEGFYPEEYVKHMEPEYERLWDRMVEESEERVEEAEENSAHGHIKAKHADLSPEHAAYSGKEDKADRIHETEEAHRKAAQEKLIYSVEHSAGKSYAALNNLERELATSELKTDTKRRLEKIIGDAKIDSAKVEAKTMMSKLPAVLGEKAYHAYKDKLKQYNEIDTTEYEKELDDRRHLAERGEAEDILKRSRRSTRKDLLDMLDAIKGRKFSGDIEKEYADRVLDAVAKLDRRRMDDACRDSANYTGEELERLYNSIKEESFLPEIKNPALDSVAKRLKRIKNEEAGLLVARLKKELQNNNVSDNSRHYFYPAADASDDRSGENAIERMEYAKGTYGVSMGDFEYPIMMVDTTRTQNGREGMLLTPEAVYYSNFVTCGSIKVENIRAIEASTGFLGKSVTAHLNDGSKVKLPHAVGTGELKGYAKALNDFVMYLKERPFSRKEKYLAKEKHDVICCFRCGYVYKGLKECPKCGYKLNV